jgi:hypothetical protein
MKSSWTRVTRDIFKVLFAMSGVALIWAAALFLVRSVNLEGRDTTELAALLFGASSLALFMMSLIIALVAVFGWQSLIDFYRAIALEAVKSSNEPLRKEISGQVYMQYGHVLGDLSLDPETFQPVNRDRLSEAIHMCQKGYDIAKEVGGPLEAIALNNLVFYSTIAGDRVRGEFLLKGARRLMELGQEHNTLMLQLTACRAILQYSGDRDEQRRAYELMSEISQNRRATDRERKEALQCIKSTPEP